MRSAELAIDQAVDAVTATVGHSDHAVRRVADEVRRKGVVRVRRFLVGAGAYHHSRCDRDPSAANGFCLPVRRDAQSVSVILVSNPGSSIGCSLTRPSEARGPAGYYAHDGAQPLGDVIGTMRSAPASFRRW